MFDSLRECFIPGGENVNIRMSGQGVVERASAELSKRINGLSLRSNKHHSRNSGSGKASVMERVTNVLCGSGHSPPDKPSRVRSKSATPGSGPGGPAAATPQSVRKLIKVHQQLQQQQARVLHLPNHPFLQQRPYFKSITDLFLDDKFLTDHFFVYFSAADRTNLAQVCTKWRDILYKYPKMWTGLVPVIRCRELRTSSLNDRSVLYSSLLRRGFRAIALVGATDEDAFDFVNSFPLATKHIHSLSLRCSCITDRGLETLVTHLQVSFVSKHSQDKVLIGRLQLVV